MISKKDFNEIGKKVKNALQTSIDKLKSENKNGYILLLINGECYQPWDVQSGKMSPYVIDFNMDRYQDSTRMKFLETFLNLAYHFDGNPNHVDNEHFRMHLELMIYTNIWESVPFVKKLYRLARLINGEKYPWKVEVPRMSKHCFLRKEVRDVFKQNNDLLGEIITKGYHSSLRNAFAHSDYYFMDQDKINKIVLTNYRGSCWELEEISFEDWEKRFAYSLLLTYHFLNIIHDRRVKIEQEFDLSSFTVVIPSKSGSTEHHYIRYAKEGDSFSFRK